MTIKMIFSFCLMLSLSAFVGDPLPECDSNDNTMCVRCSCQGDYGKMRKEGEPDNPENDKYPRRVCKNYCSRKCCKCQKPGNVALAANHCH